MIFNWFCVIVVAVTLAACVVALDRRIDVLEIAIGLEETGP